jgi:hypothetical protein
MRARKSLVLAAIAAVAFAGAALAEDPHRFFFAKDLAADLENQVGKGVKVVDEFVKIWESQEIEGYLRFDTTHFRCAIPTDQTESIAYLREVQKTLEEGKSAIPPLVAVYGTVAREPLFGEVKGGADAGVASEHILIKVDKVEKPRERFWDEGH